MTHHDSTHNFPGGNHKFNISLYMLLSSRAINRRSM